MKAVDLFCGCGGMSLGFINAGFEIEGAFDSWEPAIRTYRKNFSHPVYKADLSDRQIVPVIAGLKPDIIIGGPPCQDFSSAGRRDETMGRAALSKTYADIVTAARPEYFVMENVPQIRSSRAYIYVKDALKEAGYGMTEKVLDASRCKVPQTRKRLFLIGCLGAEDGFLDPYLEKGLSDRPMTVYDYLGDSLGTEYYFLMPRNYKRRGVFSIHEPCRTIRGVDRPIPPGYRKHPNDPVEAVPPVRPLTSRERSRIQTFPEDFIFEENKTNTGQMVGNAVPVKLAEYVASALKEYERDRKKSGFAAGTAAVNIPPSAP